MKQVMKQSKLARMLNINTFSALILALVAILGVMVVSSKAMAAAQSRYTLSEAAAGMIESTNILTREVRAYAVTGDQHHYDNYINAAAVLKNRQAEMAVMRSKEMTAEEGAVVDSVAEISKIIGPMEQAALDDVKAGRQKDAFTKVYSEEYDAAIEKIQEYQDEMKHMMDERAQARVESLQFQSKILWAVACLLMLTVVLYQFIYARMVSKKIIRPVVAVQKEMLEIAKGNLSTRFEMEPDTSEIGMLVFAILEVKRTLPIYIGDIAHKLGEMANDNFALNIEVDYIGDFAPIKEALNRIVFSLRDAMRGIGQAAEQVASGSGQVSSGAQTLSQGAAEQAGSVQELSTTIAELTEQVRQNASYAEQARTEVMIAGEELTQSNQKMNEMVEAISEINRKSGEIGGIIKTIEDIAFQTNILALNAAVEAARAGAAGKGFAVVADEVRSLAGKSAEAAKDTTALIGDTVLAVGRGAMLADETAKSVLTAVTGSKSVIHLVEQIAQQSGGQASSIQQIHMGVEQISAVVQTNSATAEESAAASEELSCQSQMLKEMVERFRLD